MLIFLHFLSENRGVVLCALIFGCAFRYLFDTSLYYVCQCTYLEFLLRVRRALYEFRKTEAAPKALAETAAAAAEPAQKRGRGGRAGADGRNAAAAAPLLRGVQLVAPERYTANGQTLVPSKRVSSLCAVADLPRGECVGYGGFDDCCAGEAASASASKSDGFFEEDDAWRSKVQCLREAAEVHRQVRQHVQRKLRPGMELLEIAEMVDSAASKLVGFDPKNPLRRSAAFPTGLSINEVAAHDTVNPGDVRRRLLPTDVLKLDFGIQIEGHIVDGAFTCAFDPMHDELMAAVREATNEGIRAAGPDARVAEIGERIREVMEAGEVHHPDGRVQRVKAIRNLTGHSIAPYRIHAVKSLPSVDTGGHEKMLPGELWAVETFGSVGGVGYVTGLGNCSHFMRPSSSKLNAFQKSILSTNAQSLLDIVDRRFGTLAFCPRWIVQEAASCKSPLLKGSSPRWWSAPLEELCKVGVVNSYPPLADLQGSYTAQYEHTVLLGARGKEILTRGDDY
eukprot:TRINITY_DN48345_c0_g1_i1.p1 TRINITY_DN48345_c0_g1~~TRINITY_DN48345_c0_g1_i1.p1  ORF type:complete len:523 (-),score=128.63 TRINITY_DN48345_c0_g1_i1:50-1573(-)